MLKEIKERVSSLVNFENARDEDMYYISKKHIIWLIEQAERTCELLTFSEYELEIIRELLSEMSCGYEREAFCFDCCEANPIIEKIDNYLTKKIR